MLNRRAYLAIALAAATSVTTCGAALAAETKIAVAANFTEPAREIAAGFEAASGHKARLSFGSSGQFYTQIANGAPYEVFLSADSERPTRAETDGLAVAGTRITYATGRLVLFSRTAGLVDAKGAVLKTSKFEKLSIADPKAAPYGQAAVETLTKLKLYDALKPRIVTGSSITQAYQYVQTGAAELGFVARSQVINATGGSHWLVPAALHKPIDQQAVLLKAGAGNPAAKAFLRYLTSKDAKAIIRRYGYEAR